MGDFGHREPSEIRQYVQLATSLRKRIVSGGPEPDNVAVTVLHVYE
jgi:hypothetical protein